MVSRRFPGSRDAQTVLFQAGPERSDHGGMSGEAKIIAPAEVAEPSILVQHVGAIDPLQGRCQ